MHWHSTLRFNSGFLIHFTCTFSGVWEEAGENPCRHRKKMQNPYRKIPQPSHCSIVSTRLQINLCKVSCTQITQAVIRLDLHQCVPREAIQRNSAADFSTRALDGWCLASPCLQQNVMAFVSAQCHMVQEKNIIKTKKRKNNLLFCRRDVWPVRELERSCPFFLAASRCALRSRKRPLVQPRRRNSEFEY